MSPVQVLLLVLLLDPRYQRQCLYRFQHNTRISRPVEQHVQVPTLGLLWHLPPNPMLQPILLHLKSRPIIPRGKCSEPVYQAHVVYRYPVRAKLSCHLTTSAAKSAVATRSCKSSSSPVVLQQQLLLETFGLLRCLQPQKSHIPEHQLAHY